jgi:uncharacterized protein
MKSKLIRGGNEKTFVLVFRTGDEAMAELAGFAKEQRLAASHFSGIGAFRDLVLGYFEWERRAYRRISLSEQVEVLSLVGDIAVRNGEPTVHAHVVVGKADGSAHGGHLLEGRVRPTLEVVLVESPAHLRRTQNAESGLALIDLDA